MPERAYRSMLDSCGLRISERAAESTRERRFAGELPNVACQTACTHRMGSGAGVQKQRARRHWIQRLARLRTVNVKVHFPIFTATVNPAICTK